MSTLIDPSRAQDPKAISDSNMTPQSQYRCLSVPRLCSSIGREHIWQIDVSPDRDLLEPRENNYRVSDWQTPVLQELARLSCHVDSLLVGQGKIERILNIVCNLKELPQDLAKLRSDIGLAFPPKLAEDVSENAKPLVKMPLKQPRSTVPGQWMDEPKEVKESKLKDRADGRLSEGSRWCSSGTARHSEASARLDARHSVEASTRRSNDCADGRIPEDSKWCASGSARQSEASSEFAGRYSLQAAARHSNESRSSIAMVHTLQGKLMFGDHNVPQTCDALEEPEYDVANFYYNTGYCQLIARHERFHSGMLLVICANALYIGWEASSNTQNASDATVVMFTILDNMFCACFMIEWWIRFAAFQSKCNCLKDMWFRFDTILVLLMMADTWLLPVFFSKNSSDTKVTGLIKLMRLLRLARIGRVLRALPELVAMIKGLKVASRAVGAAFLMLIMLIYVFSIALFVILKGIQEDFLKSRFGYLDTVMWTILFDGTLLDNPGLIVRSLLSQDERVAVAIFLVFILASALTVMNMLIGVLCQVVTSVAESEKDSAAVRLVREQLLVLLQELDEDGSGSISRPEIAQVLNNEVALSVLHSLRVDEASLLANLDMFYEKGEDLSMQQIMELILLLRGDTQPSMRHFIHMQEFLQWKLSGIFHDNRDALRIETSQYHRDESGCSLIQNQVAAAID